VKLLLVGILVVVVLAVVRMLLPWQPPPIYPVLGYSANAPISSPTPAPVGTPRPVPAAPPAEVR
jgi:hypothetical protein